MKLKKLAAVLCAALMLVSGTSCGLLDKLFGGGETAEKAAPTLESLTVTASVEFNGEKTSLALEGELSSSDYESLKGYNVDIGLLAVPEDYALGELKHDSKFTGMKSAKNLEAKQSGDSWTFSTVFDGFEEVENTANIFVRAYVHVTDLETKKTVVTGYSTVRNTNFAYLSYVALQSDTLGSTEREKAQTLVGDLVFYEITCDDGVTPEYDYAYAGQTVRLDIETIYGKSLKKLKFIATTGEVTYDAGTKSFVMPAANVAITPEYISGLKNPMIIAGLQQTDAVGYWYSSTGKHWAFPSDMVKTGFADNVDITDEDYAALKKAGYRGYLDKRYASRIPVEDKNRWRTVAFWFYEGMDHPFWENVGSDGIYVSIWLKSSVGFGSSRRFMTYNPTTTDWSIWSHDQDDFYAQWQEFHKPNGWQELTMNVECFKRLKNENGYQLGVLFWNLEDDSEDVEQYITVWGAEVMHEGIEQPAGPVDIAINTQGLPYSDTFAWNLYLGDRLLERGKDYRVNGTTVYGLQKGDYTIVYD
ncbi:MAG: hypothetical protein IJD33_05240, partial [Clostridia bacterium]|nr:hypothetical protein [Clostridia bacterium]